VISFAFDLFDRYIIVMNIGIIGGGAAGMMAAASILEDDSFQGQIFLWDKNPGLGAKIIISG
jgi:predicted flavoprotein YhiN